MSLPQQQTGKTPDPFDLLGYAIESASKYQFTECFSYLHDAMELSCVMQIAGEDYNSKTFLRLYTAAHSFLDSCIAESVRKEREYRENYVYFIQDVHSKHIKIGFSLTPDMRLKSLQTANSTSLDIIGVISGDISLEKGLHKRFNHLHVVGEWFLPGKDLLKFIETKKIGSVF